MKTILNILALTLLLFSLSWWSMSSLTFFNSDSGIRFWQVRELIEHNWQTLAIEYPARHLDPDFEFVPLYCAYALVDGELFFSITPFLPLLASFFYVWLGTIGLAVMPVLAGVLAAIGAYKLAQLSRLSRPHLVLWSSMLATPLFFYSLQLWDHSLAIACAVWGVYGVALGITRQRWQPILLGGVVTAVGLWQRPELSTFALALAAGLFIVTWPRWQPVLALAAGGVIGTAPIAWWQYKWVGHPLGMVSAAHLLDYGRPEAYTFPCQSPTTAVKISRFLVYIGSRDPWSFTAALLVIAALFLLIFWLRLPQLQKPWLLLIALGTAVAGYLMYGVMLWRGALPGLITTFPLLGFSLAYLDSDRDQSSGRPIYRLTLYTTLIFLAAMILVWPAYGGDHWGGRYLLPAYPLLVVLAFYVYERYQAQGSLPRTLQLVGITLLVASILLQLIGVRLLLVKQQEDIVLRDAIAVLPAEIILTNHPFLPTSMTSLDDKTFMYIESEADIATLVPRFAAHGITHFALISLYYLPLSVPDQVGNFTIRQLTPIVYELEES